MPAKNIDLAVHSPCPKPLSPHKSFTILLPASDNYLANPSENYPMKTINLCIRLVNRLRSRHVRPLLLCSLLGFGALGLIGFMTRGHEGFVAHEWGTFTSVQGGDGVLLDWRPLESSRLPGFVYNWQHPGLKRQARGVGSPFTKTVMITLQRMETPVIYFYAEDKQTVDVTVDFPQGTITEWYPQATRIGPSTTPVPAGILKLDEYAHKIGVKPSFTFASFTSTPATAQSRAQWAHIGVLPPKNGNNPASSLPLDTSGSHYFAARETDANLLEMSSLDATNPVPEHEKFIFYRGAGNFATPLRVTLTAENTVSIANTGTEPLTHLIVLGLDRQAGNFVHIKQLAPGETQTVRMNAADHPERLQKLSVRLGERMVESLVSEGLYRREATAMVSTWRDSWFEEDGLRVLYVLPRAWTDRTLPMKIDPAPRELVRVMVGRAEVLSSALQHSLLTMLQKASQGDNDARAQTMAEFKKLGRFAEPALRLATQGTSSQVSQTAWTLFQASLKPGA
jgi:hypothetical protein